MTRHTTHVDGVDPREGVPFLLGAAVATSVSLGLWIVVSWASWLVLHLR